MCFATIVIDVFIKMFEQKKDHEHLSEKLKTNKDRLLNNFVSVAKHRNAQKFICLCHGDMWSTNIMLKRKEAKHSEKASVEHVLFMNWGKVNWQNPIFYLEYLIYSSTSLSLRQSHLEDVLQHYFSPFVTTTNHLNDPIFANSTFEDLENEWSSMRIYGVLFGVMINMMSLRKAEDN